MRLSAYCSKILNMPRREAKQAIKDGLILINGKRAKKDIEVSGTENVSTEIRKENPQFNAEEYELYKDNQYVFLYKPPFMHSERIKQTDPLTMSDIFKSYPQYTPLSRLDYETDGVTAAINNDTDIYKISKTYLAVTAGKFPDNLTISNKIDASRRIKVKVLNDTGGFKTYMRRLSFDGTKSMIEVTLEKAARHQVRAFAAYAGHPILGDKIYGAGEPHRLMLHCKSYTINDKTILCEEKTVDFLRMYETGLNTSAAVT